MKRRRSRANRTDQITRDVTICGKRGCKRMQATIDTGATSTFVTAALAKALGMEPGGAGGVTHTANGTVRHQVAKAKVCLKSKGCGCLNGTVSVLPAKDFGGSHILLGMDYLDASRAKIDCSKGTVRCSRRRPR